MSERIQAIRGMNDVLPEETFLWRQLEQIFSQCLMQYGYKEIRTPLLESTSLFKRTIGEVTDIVEKEMYTFTDLNGESITLRPEGTASCVRACLEHGLLHNQQQKLWYCGSMFRHEKPQKGRYRQFNQFGVEALGIPGVGIELELIAICKRLWEILGISAAVELQINSLGELSERLEYREELVAYLNKHFEQLDEDSKRRLDRNPLRILDSKNPDMQALISQAPKFLDKMGEASRQHFQSLCDGLKVLGIPYTINPFLVRGLDYYGHTVFEWVTDKLGSQATVCAGGRFDKLIEHLGGNPTPAVGFALGIERLLLLRETLSLNQDKEAFPDVFFIVVSEDALQRALVLAESLRNENPRRQILVHTAGGSFKSQFKKADKSGARLALILGEDEMAQQTIGIKDLRHPTEQQVIKQKDLNQYLQSYLQ
ncbi:histidine--tRNA ligase [Legionella septentrionalis]|nr:histidine--tRNA ligase [Legionella septentrionalis]RUQ95076.1 histidine--tRNA ligase [Legionella septentrionalis]RUR09460.1 histidine--tRNA ligase [Legionella septentrionalis]RUR13708.1 histidine--tRNA ligase [Legionella septentrionalis]